MNEYRKIGQTIFVNTKEDIDEVVETAEVFNSYSNPEIHKISDIKNEKVREILSLKRFKTSSNLIDIDKLKKALCVQPTVAQAMLKSKNIQKALNSCKSEIAENTMIAIALDTKVIVSKETLQSILTSLGKDFEKDRFGKVVVDEWSNILSRHTELTKKQIIELSSAISEGLHKLTINELLAKNAAAKINKLVGNKNGFCCIAEPKSEDWKKIVYSNPYNHSRMRGDILMYNNSDYAFGELFSFMNSDYYETVGKKIVISAQGFIHNYKGITSDKAHTIEEARELMQKAMETNDTYVNASLTEKAQYDWVALNDLTVGETNLDVLYNLFFMLAERMGVASKMPKDKYSLFCK